jgi:tRNA_anti-like
MIDPMSSAALERRAPYEVRAHHKRCGKCGKLVSRAAFVCRRCGRSQRIKPRTILLVLSVVFVAGMFAVASASALTAQSRAPEASTAPAGAAVVETMPAPDATGAASITAEDLWAAYVRDPAGADRRFKDRSLLVSGMVRSVGRDFDGRAMVRLSTGDPYESVNAKLATRSEASVAAMSKGKSVSLLCMGRGRLIGAPQLTACFVR